MLDLADAAVLADGGHDFVLGEPFPSEVGLDPRAVLDQLEESSPIAWRGRLRVADRSLIRVSSRSDDFAAPDRPISSGHDRKGMRPEVPVDVASVECPRLSSPTRRKTLCSARRRRSQPAGPVGR